MLVSPNYFLYRLPYQVLSQVRFSQENKIAGPEGAALSPILIPSPLPIASFPQRGKFQAYKRQSSFLFKMDLQALRGCKTTGRAGAVKGGQYPGPWRLEIGKGENCTTRGVSPRKTPEATGQVSHLSPSSLSDLENA